MKTIAFLNRKGGVGKTSCCHHLAGTLAAAGRRVLLVDNDPQASLSKGLLGPAAAESLDPGVTIASIYVGEVIPTAALVLRTEWPGIELLPGSAACDEANVADPWDRPRPDQLALANALGEVHGYDLALIDCPPNLLGCSWAALAAADGYVVPLQPEDYGAQGITGVLEFAGRCRAALNPRLALLGLLVTMSDRRKTIHRIYESNLRATFGDEVFAASVPDLVAFAEAITRRCPVTQYEPKGKAAAEIAVVADELLGRLGVTGFHTRPLAGKGVA